MNVYWHNGYNIIEEDFEGQIDEKFINEVINSLLRKWKYITRDLERCVRNDNILIICPYGPLSHHTLSRTIKKIINGFGVEYDFFYDLPKPLVEKLEDFLPLYTNYKNAIASGPTEDSREIDPNVECLVDAINTFTGIETFSSCEGHPPNRKMYVLFHCEEIKYLNNFSYYFDKYISELWNKYNLYTTDVNVNLSFEYGRWKHMTGVFFEVSIQYDDHKIMFELVKELSWLIKEAALKEM